MPKQPPKTVKCVRKGCGKCLFCLKIMVLCECKEEDKAGEPKNVMYGWCSKCRNKLPDDYKKLVGNNCTYCGGAIENNYPPIGLFFGVVLFPIGLLICCMLREKQC